MDACSPGGLRPVEFCGRFVRPSRSEEAPSALSRGNDHQVLMFVLLVGPKGSGKSHIGRLLARSLGVRFFHVEPLWMSYYAVCSAGGSQPTISEGIARVHPRIVEALRASEHVCVETTGASKEILDDLLSLEDPSKTVVVRVSAPLELCLDRIAARDQTNQIPMDVESIRAVHSLGNAAELDPKLTLENIALTDDEILSSFENLPGLASGRDAPTDLS